VLAKTLEIPRGEVRPYAWIAREIGHPAAVRAAGSALGRNPVPILIPCHRVVRSDGATGNYGFGPQLKVDLLQVEKVNLDETRQLGRRGVHYLASDTTSVFCYPSCTHARRITPAHRVELANVVAARAGGYRPCRHCRPA
jgi:methylated-DNA-[protein]-cysteine S-methyltransferase